MCKVIATLTFLLTFSILLFGAKAVPVVELPPKPTKEFLNKISKNPSLYSETIISYYTISTAYVAQLDLMGVKPTIRVVAPSLDELSKPSQKVLNSRMNQALTLNRQITSLDAAAEGSKIESLRKSEYELRNELLQLRSDTAKLRLKLKELSVYPELYDESLVVLKELKKQQKSKLVPTLGLSVGANALLFLDDDISSNAGPNVGVTLNPITSGIGKPLGLWFDYSALKIKTNNLYNDYWYPFTLNHNANVISVGANVDLLGIPLHLAGMEYCPLKIKVGAGYQWIDVSTPNYNANNHLWKGVAVKGEIEYRNLCTRYPFGVYVSTIYQHVEPTLDFIPNNGQFSKGVFSLNAGLKFFLTGGYK